MVLQQEYSNVTWHKWQQEVLDIINEKPHPRTINWYWEPTGNVGKSFICKFIALRQEVIVASGKKNDIYNEIHTVLSSGIIPTIIVLDYPRHDLDYINYGAIECIKNGFLYSGKYEGGKCIFPIPHVIVFANEPPDITKMSSDRWHIVKIE